MNRITFNLYSSTMKRYINPIQLRLRVTGGNGVKVSKLVITREGTSIGTHILNGTTNVIGNEEVVFNIQAHSKGASRFSVVFTG